MNVKLITLTPEAEETMGYIARVSNPKNQDNPKVAGLLDIVLNIITGLSLSKHHMTIEINTTRGLAAQILRHRSFTFKSSLKGMLIVVF